MNILKKIGAPLVAVALVAVMGVSLIGTTDVAHAAANTVSAQTPTVGLGTAGGGLTAATNPIPAWSGGTTLNPITFTLAAGDTWVGTIVLTAPAATTFKAIGAAAAGAASSTCTVTVVATATEDATAHCTAVVAANVLTITSNGAAATATSKVTITPPALVVPNGTAAGGTVVLSGTTPGTTVGFTLPAGVVATLGAGKDFLVSWSASTTCAATPPTNGYTAATATADSAGVGGALCAYYAPAGVVTAGLPVTFTVSLGVVSTGTAKTAIAVTATNGAVGTNYRGGGGLAGTDTAIISNSLNNVVDTLPITLTAPTGNTAAKIIIQQPTNVSVSSTLTNVSPGYVSPLTQTNFAVQVQDTAGLGVGGQVVLITTDKGYLAAGFNAVACGTSKALTATTSTAGAPQALTVGGTAVAGAVSVTYCGNQLDAPGQATITVQNITTSMANATTTIATAGRPAKVDATYSSGVITAKVTDANGNKVPDGTAVQFTISQNAGAVSNACTTTTNGQAQSAVSLNTASGSVIVTAIWNETGALAAGCAAVAAVAQGGNAGAVGSVGTSLGGAQSVSSVINIGGAVTPPGTSTGSTGGGSGAFASSPVYSASKQALAVFGGGTVEALDKAVTGANGTGVWAQDSKGGFVLYIIGGGFVNDAFKAAFPSGLAANSAVTVIGK